MSGPIDELYDGPGGAGGGGGSYAPASLEALYDPNSYVGHGSTTHNSSTGLVRFANLAVNTNGVSITGPATSQNAPCYKMRLDTLSGFDPALHTLWVRLSSVSLANELGRPGLAIWLSATEDGGGTDTGGPGVYVNATNDDRGCEGGNTSTSTGTLPTPAGKIVEVEASFDVTTSGELRMGHYYKTTGDFIVNKSARRDVDVGTLLADELWLKIGFHKLQTNNMTDGALFEAIVEVGYAARPT